MAAPIVTGLLAFGMSGRLFHAPFVHAHPGFQLKAIVERTKKVAQGHYPDVLSYDSTEELLNDPEIEFIIVNTPNNTHYDLSKRALLAGKHVLTEKPAGATVAEVQELYDLARRVGKHYLVFQNRRWDSDFLSVKEVIESGKLGRLIEINCRYDRYRPTISVKKFKEDASLTSAGITYDLAPHLIDQMISLFGKPLTWTKTEASHRENSTVTDYFSFHLTFPHQINVFLSAGWLIAQPLPSFVIHGSLGSFIKSRTDIQEELLDKNVPPTDASYGIEHPGSEGVLTEADMDAKTKSSRLTAPKGDYTHLFEAAYHTIRENALFPITEEHIMWQMEMLEA
ncbi:Gfo/Idh/MocA family oxidoreductase [Mucilaginibacter myungsuensis]|uniref:Gfo/Idh/MocA family oxidoreductase n=1 Tax=Mucilaginibacter myungsuensis TaxID=649104 RepID=A0A929PXV0_9SPHI|nr:Gfo/Idh/MocA family oxidoreductase [Mucilaginibacter myungsuensis]MBE9663514.1 Gfo/Idh/MocA family oxidoreductase [Mucilaginibacter myungsuensis]MDN3600252.1 Gfo/Idh/MocA family oxidoreductase [Mucilaginibacter myungsuensis]